MTSDKVFKLLCIYCYKPCSQNSPIANSIGFENERKLQQEEIFLKLLSRHLKINRNNKACFEQCISKACNDCLGIVTKFCELYHQFKCLELQLNWQVDKLWNVMRWADRVPSRLKEFRNIGDFERKLEFRKIFKRKCKRYFTRQPPRVLLQLSVPFSGRNKTEVSSNAEVLVNQEINVTRSVVEFPGMPVETELHAHHDDDEQMECDKKEHSLLGWISTFTALIFLYHLNTPKAIRLEKELPDPDVVNKEPKSLQQVILESKSQPPLGRDTNNDDLTSNTECYDESHNSPCCNSSTNDDDFVNEQSNCVNDGNNDIEEEPSSSLNISLPLSSHKPIFVVEETPELLSSKNNEEHGCSLTKHEVPVTIFDQQSVLNQEYSAPYHSQESVNIALALLSSPNVQNIEIGDVKLAFSSTPLQPFHSPSVPAPEIHPVVPLYVDAPQKHVAPEEPEQNSDLTTETPVLSRRSLRTKFQCSNCKATFSDVRRFENHSNLCNQSTSIESETDSEEHEEEAVVKVEIDVQPMHNSNNRSVSLTKEGKGQHRRSTRKSINYDHEMGDDDDWKNDDGKFETESEPPSENEFSGDDMNYGHDNETKPTIRSLPSLQAHSCTKCDLNFSNRFAFRLHENYKHSKGQFHITTTYIKNIHLTRSSLKLEGVSLEVCFPCTLDPDNCTRKYPLSKELEEHCKLHGQFSCHICDVTLTDALDLVDHEVEHTDEQEILKDKKFRKGDVYHCARCDYKATVIHEIVNHYLSDHLGLPEIEAECPICQQKFPYNDTVPLKHYLNYHDINRLDDHNDRVICSEQYCHAYFLREDQLHNHWTTEHSNMELKMADVKNKNKQKKNRNKLKLIENRGQKCPYCRKTFICTKNLNLHISLNHLKNTGKSIGERVISKDGLTVDDWVFENGAKYFCKMEGCKEKFVEEEDFEIHSKQHGVFPCNFCENVSWRPRHSRVGSR